MVSAAARRTQVSLVIVGRGCSSAGGRWQAGTHNDGGGAHVSRGPGWCRAHALFGRCNVCRPPVRQTQSCVLVWFNEDLGPVPAYVGRGTLVCELAETAATKLDLKSRFGLAAADISAFRATYDRTAKPPRTTSTAEWLDPCSTLEEVGMAAGDHVVFKANASAASGVSTGGEAVADPLLQRLKLDCASSLHMRVLQ